MGRQINGTSEGIPGSLWKQGSLNLPAPEESGFPATHPDMCILRIRRNHLLEVGRFRVLGGGSLLQGGSCRLAPCKAPAVVAAGQHHIVSAVVMLWHGHLTALFCASINQQDALDEIARQKPKDLFKPLRVHFIGEDGIDAGWWWGTDKVGAGHSSPWTSHAVWAFSLLSHL